MINFVLDPKAGIPFYRQIIDQIKFGIVTGRLKIGEQLPTVRGLAVDLKINLNTVSKAVLWSSIGRLPISRGMQSGLKFFIIILLLVYRTVIILSHRYYVYCAYFPLYYET